MQAENFNENKYNMIIDDQDFDEFVREDINLDSIVVSNQNEQNYKPLWQEYHPVNAKFYDFMRARAQNLTQ